MTAKPFKSILRLTPQQLREATALCRELPVIEDRLRRAGLLATAAAMNMAVKRIGYEVTEKMP